MRNIGMDIMNKACAQLNIELSDLLSHEVRLHGMSPDPVDDLIHEIKQHGGFR